MPAALPQRDPEVESIPFLPILQSSKAEKGLLPPPSAVVAPGGRGAGNKAVIAMRVALFEPDIPQNAGTIIRTAACLGIAVDLIEPCGFVLSDRQFRRAGLDYVERAVISRAPSWAAFRAAQAAAGRRTVLLTTRAATAYTRFRYRACDVLLLGRESGGVPDAVHAEADARVRIVLADGCRSLNVAMACAMVLGEALRQTEGLPLDVLPDSAAPNA